MAIATTDHNPNHVTNSLLHQLLELTNAQTIILAHDYRRLGLEFHALPLHIRTSSQIPPATQAFSRDVFVLAPHDGGALPMPVMLLRLLDEDLAAVTRAWGAERWDTAYEVLLGAEQKLERLGRCLDAVGEVMGGYRSLLGGNTRGERQAEFEERVEEEGRWVGCLPVV